MFLVEQGKLAVLFFENVGKDSLVANLAGLEVGVLVILATRGSLAAEEVACQVVCGPRYHAAR